MVIDFYNRGGGGGGTADYATEAGSSKLLEGSNAFPQSANTGDVVAITESQAKKGGLRSVNLEAGVYQYDGADWNKIGEGEGGDSHTVIAVDNLNDGNLDAANCGDVRAKYVLHEETVETGGTTPSSGETFPSDGTMKCDQFDSLDDINGLIWKNGPDVWQMSFSNDTMTATLLEGDGTRTASETTVDESGTVEGGDYHYTYLDGSQTTILEIANYGKNWEGFSASQSMQDYIFTFIPGEANWTGEAVNTYKTAEGVWQYKENPEWGRWFGGNSLPCGDENYGGTFLVYDYLPFTSPTKICKLSRNLSDNGRYLFYVNDHFATYTSESPDFDSPVDEIYAGVEVTITNVGIGNYKIYWDSSKKFLRFTANYNGVWEAINTSLSGYGWEAVEKNETIEFKTSDKTINGIPKWTKDGKIIGREVGYNAKTFYLNTNGYSNNLTVLTNGQNGGSYGRMFFPTVGGSAGQVLTSAGDNAEPTWATLIKSVKITSDAYEALETKDPNVLYLIVD